MNNTQLYLAIGLPALASFTTLIAVFLAWLSNRSDINRLNDKVDHLAQSLNARIDAMNEAHHKDNLALMGYMVPLHERMAKLESRN
jgi:hypothetical protein